MSIFSKFLLKNCWEKNCFLWSGIFSFFFFFISIVSYIFFLCQLGLPFQRHGSKSEQRNWNGCKNRKVVFRSHSSIIGISKSLRFQFHLLNHKMNVVEQIGNGKKICIQFLPSLWLINATAFASNVKKCGKLLKDREIKRKKKSIEKKKKKKHKKKEK